MGSIIIFLLALLLSAKAQDPLCIGYPEDEVVLFPDPVYCDRYYKCLNGELSEEQCEEGLYFSEINKGCVPPDYADCVGGTGVYSTETSPVKSTTSPITESITPARTTTSSTASPTPTTPTTTPPTTSTRSSTLTTTSPLTSTTERTSPTPDITSPPGTTESVLDPRCEEDETSFWPHPSECGRYIECYQGNSYEMACPPNQYFSDNQKSCVEASESECCAEKPSQCR